VCGIPTPRRYGSLPGATVSDLRLSLWEFRAQKSETPAADLVELDS
jgi:hypothetical protein